jgi:hypothetical protein
VLRLSRSGRAVRLTVTAAVLLLLLAGAVWGIDDSFPFGPFRMYSTRADPDRPVISTRVLGVTASGGQVLLSGGEVGLRRAEFEGQLSRIQDRPQLLGLLADGYGQRHPSAPVLQEIRVVQQRTPLRDGAPTGRTTERVLVSFPLKGHS